MKVALYARVSTPEQAKKDLSIPDQIRQMKEYCGRGRHEIVREYREEGITATDDKRPAFKEMMEEAVSSSPPFQAILVLTTSRFFRDATLARICKHDLKKKGIKVIAITQEVSDDPAGFLTEGFFELIDEYESRINGFHTLRGMKENARRGFGNGSTPPFGYRWKKVVDERGNPKSKLEVNPKESSIVKAIFKLYAKTRGAKKTAEELNAQGKFARSNKLWGKNKVFDIISDTTYIGKYTFNKKDRRLKKLKDPSEWITIDVEPILDKTSFQKVQNIRKQNESQKTNRIILISPTLLTGILKCGKCGSSMTLETAKNRDNRYYRYYNCRNFIRIGKKACEGQRIPCENFEDAILRHLSEKLFSKERVKKMLAGLTQSLKGLRNKNKKHLRQFKTALSDINRRLSKQYEAIETGIVTAQDVGDRIRELKSQRGQLQDEISKAQIPETAPLHLFTERNISAFQQVLKELFFNKSSEFTKRYLRFLLEKVVLTGKKVEIVAKTRSVCAAITNKKAVGEKVPTAINWLPG